MTQSEEGILQLSTDAIPERDRVAVWREDWGQRFLTVDIEPDRRGPFHALMLLRTLPGLKIAKVHFSPLVARRTRGLIAGDPDGLFVLANLAGSMTLSQRGCQLTVGPGDALLASCAETLIADHRVPDFPSVWCSSLTKAIPSPTMRRFSTILVVSTVLVAPRLPFRSP